MLKCSCINQKTIEFSTIEAREYTFLYYTFSINIHGGVYQECTEKKNKRMVKYVYDSYMLLFLDKANDYYVFWVCNTYLFIHDQKLYLCCIWSSIYLKQ